MEYSSQFSPGIDVSYWNTYNPFTFEAAVEAGVEWVMVRAGKGGQETGTDDRGQDLRLAEMVDQAVAVNLPYTAYWRVYDVMNSDPNEQASLAHLAWSAAGSPRPYVIDIEELWQGASGTDPLGLDVVQHWLTTFRLGLAAFGLTDTAVYTRRTWWDPYVQLAWGDVPLFTAHWIRDEVPADARLWEHWAWMNLPNGPWVPHDWSGAEVWQFASTGSAFGSKIGLSSDDLDCNLMYRGFLDQIIS